MRVAGQVLYQYDPGRVCDPYQKLGPYHLPMRKGISATMQKVDNIKYQMRVHHYLFNPTTPEKYVMSHVQLLHT